MAKALATGTEARNRPASESAAAGLPVAARSALSAGVKLTSGANNASMIRPSRTLRISIISLTWRPWLLPRRCRFLTLRPSDSLAQVLGIETGHSLVSTDRFRVPDTVTLNSDFWRKINGSACPAHAKYNSCTTSMRTSACPERVLFAPCHKKPESGASRGLRLPFALYRVFLTIDWLILTRPPCGYGRPYWCNSF